LENGADEIRREVAGGSLEATTSFVSSAMVQTGPSTAVARVPRLVLLAVLVVGTLLIAMVSECTAARVRQVGVGYRRSFVPAAGGRKRRGDADPTFDPQFSSKMAVLSAVAYCPDDTITNWSCRACTSDPHLSGLRIEQPVKLFESRALELSPITAYVALMKEEDVGLGGTDPAVKALVVFRGTASIYDWVVNLDFYRKKAWDSCGDKCYVHSGFDDVRSHTPHRCAVDNHHVTVFVHYSGYAAVCDSHN